jgi:hypothetical protein
MQSIEFTNHALRVMQIRGIREEWVLRGIHYPTLRTQDPVDPDVERFYTEVMEMDNRVLRIAVNTTTTPWRIITVFPDRNMRGKL